MSKISFSKERDFSALFSDSISFLKQNFKGFFGAILLIAGPFLLVSGAAMGFLQSIASNARNMVLYGGRLDSTTLFTSIGILFFSAFVGSMVLYCVVYNYMILYNNKPEGEPVTVSEVAKEVWRTIWRTMGSLLVVTLIAILAFAILGLAAFGISSALGLAGTVIIGFALVVALLIYGPVLGYVFQAMFFVVIRDDIFGIDAFGKVWKYMKGNFWWTWVVIVVGSFALYIVNLLFTLPATIYSLVGTFTRMGSNGYTDGSSNSTIILVTLYTLGMFFSYFTSSVLLVLSAFNFLSHEEVHEGKGLFSKIDEIK
jgi:hypothetical protein